MSDTLKAGLRERLGVTDADATDDVLLAAVDEALAESDSTTAGIAAGSVPEGAVVVDAGVLDQLKRDAAQGVQARNEQISAHRDGVVAAALREGRITAESRDRWRDALDRDEAGITGLLGSFEANSTVPVVELGVSDSVTDAESALYERTYGARKEGV